MNVNKAKDLIEKLQKVAIDQASSESEVLIATKKIQDLCLKFHLELNEISSEETKRDIKDKIIFKSGRLLWYEETLIGMLKEFFLVSVYKSRMGKDTSIHVMGFEEDIIIYESIYLFLSNCMKSIFKKKKKENSDLDRNEFYMGFINSIKECLQINKDKNKDKWEIVLVNDDLKAETDKLNLKKKTKTGIQPKFTNDVSSYAKGFQEGKNAYEEYGKKSKIDCE